MTTLEAYSAAMPSQISPPSHPLLQNFFQQSSRLSKSTVAHCQARCAAAPPHEMA